MTKSKPTYDAYGTRKSYWTRLGVGFVSEKGVSLYLDAMPPTGENGQYELVLLPYKDRKAEAGQPEDTELS